MQLSGVACCGFMHGLKPVSGYERVADAAKARHKCGGRYAARAYQPDFFQGVRILVSHLAQMNGIMNTWMRMAHMDMRWRAFMRIIGMQCPPRACTRRYRNMKEWYNGTDSHRYLRAGTVRRTVAA